MFSPQSFVQVSGDESETSSDVEIAQILSFFVLSLCRLARGLWMNDVVY